MTDTQKAANVSTEVLPESVRQEYLQAMGVQVWYDPELDFQLAEDTQPASPVTEERVKPQNPETKVEPVAEAISEPALDNVTSMTSLVESIQSCQLCELHTLRNRAMPGEGNAQADLMIVTDAPLDDGAVTDVLFAELDKQMLQAMLQAIDIDLSSVYLTSLVKCQPPEQRAPYTSEMICCDDHLTAQIKFIQPKVIMILGEQASQQLLLSQKSLADLRLRQHQHLSVPVYASCHPHDLIDSAEMKRKVWQDLLQIKKQLV